MTLLSLSVWLLLAGCFLRWISHRANQSWDDHWEDVTGLFVEDGDEK